MLSWLLAYFRFGITWVVFVMLGAGTYYRTSLRRVRRNFRDDINREMAKTRMDSDTESLEWINSFVVKLWPLFAPIVCDQVIQQVDQVLATVTPPMIDALRLKTFTLGTKPPRLEYVKTYPKTDPDFIVMDWRFSFTPNDMVDMTSQQIKDKVNPKIVLEIRLGKGPVSKGMDVIVADMAMAGLIRIRFKLQLTLPLIERIDVCFLEKPFFDYVCKPLGGDTLGMDINFIPGLESFIKDQVHSNLGPMFYSPNVFPVEVAKILAGGGATIGVVAVTLHGARNLKNPDAFAGAPDPYATVSVNEKEEIGRTKIVHGTDSPKWGTTIYVIASSFADALTIAVYDFNDYRKDKKLGVATFTMDQLETTPENEGVNLEVQSSGRSRGGVIADIRFFPVLLPTTTESGVVEPPPESNSGIAKVTIEQAKALGSGKPNPYAVLEMNGKEIHASKKVKRQNNAIFPDPSKEFLVTDRKGTKLSAIIKDDKDSSNNPTIGQHDIKLNDLLAAVDKGQEWFQLSGTSKGLAKLTMEWKPVALGGISGGMGYMDPIGVFRVHFKAATGLRNLEAMGKSDPYARAVVSGITQGRTVTFRSNLDPDWDEVVYVPIRSPREKLVLEVMDEETNGSDRSLGSMQINASDFVQQGEDGQWLVDDEMQTTNAPLSLAKEPPKGTLHYTAAFYPNVPIITPKELEEKKKEEEEAAEQKAKEEAASAANGKKKPDSKSTKSAKSSGSASAKTNGSTNGTKKKTNGEKEGEEEEEGEKEIPKTLITSENVGDFGMATSFFFFFLFSYKKKKKKKKGS